MRPLALLSALLLGAACRPLPAPAGRGPGRGADPPLPIASLAVDFPKRDEGTLSFSVPLPQGAPPARAVTWELFVRSRRFAAGVEGAPEVVSADGGVTVRVAVPLTWRHLGWREGPTYLDVGVRGEVLAGDEATPTRLRFEGRREVLAHGAPDFDEVRE